MKLKFSPCCVAAVYSQTNRIARCSDCGQDCVPFQIEITPESLARSYQEGDTLFIGARLVDGKIRRSVPESFATLDEACAWSEANGGAEFVDQDGVRYKKEPSAELQFFTRLARNDDYWEPAGLSVCATFSPFRPYISEQQPEAMGGMPEAVLQAIGAFSRLLPTTTMSEVVESFAPALRAVHDWAVATVRDETLMFCSNLREDVARCVREVAREEIAATEVWSRNENGWFEEDRLEVRPKKD